MRSILLMVIHMLLLYCLITKLSIAQQKYDIVIDTEGRSGILDTREGSNGSILMCGAESNPLENDKKDAFVTKIISENSVVHYLFDFGEDTNSILHQLIITPENDYLFFGSIGKPDSNEPYKRTNYFWVLKLSQDMDMIWEKRLKVAGDYWNPSFKAWQSNDLIYIAGNVDWWDGYYRSNFFMAKFNMEGDSLKTHYPFIDDPMQWPLGSVVGGTMGRYNSLEGIMVVGDNFSPADNYGILEIDSDLNYTFLPNSYPNLMSLDIPSIIRFNEESYLWASWVSEPNQDNSDMVIARVNQNHVFTDYTVYGRTDTADRPARYKAIDFKEKNDIFVASRNNHWTFDPVDLKVSVALFDSTMNIKGWKWYGGDMNYYIYTITATNDGGCVIGGTVCDWQNSSEGDVDLWVKKIYAEDLITHAEETPDPTDSDVLICPNPGGNVLKVKTFRQNLRLMLYNNNGNLLLNRNIDKLPDFTFSTEELKAGNYLCQIFDSEKKMVIDSGTWIKTK